MTENVFANDQSIDIEYGDFINSLQNSELPVDPTKHEEQGDDEPVEELNDDDSSSNFSNDNESDDDSGMEESQLLALHVCDPCQQESLLTTHHSDCSNLAMLVMSLSDALGYDPTATTISPPSSLRNLPQSIAVEEVASFESPTPPLDSSTILTTSSEDSSETSNKDSSDAFQQNVASDEDNAIEYTNCMHDDLQVLDTLEQALQCPTSMGNQLDLPFDEEEQGVSPSGQQVVDASETAAHMNMSNNADKEMNQVPVSKIIAADSLNHKMTNYQQSSSSAGIDQQPTDDDILEKVEVSASPIKGKHGTYYVETSFMSTVLDDESISDWDGGSFDQPVQEKKKRRFEKWHCCYICNALLVIIIVVMIIIVAVNLLDSSSTTQAAGIAPSFPSINAPSGPPTTTTSYGPSYSQQPTNLPSWQPTWSIAPSTSPSMSPTALPSSSPTHGEYETTFYAIGDVPYNNLEKIQLRDRMINLPQDGEFLIHVGDIRSGQDKVTPCRLEEYEEVRDILLQSEIPVFIIPGDNEWTDCPNTFEGRYFWRKTFADLDKNWNLPFQVVRHPLQPENFYFVHKRTLYFGLNLVSGGVLESYSMELDDHAEFIKSMMDELVVGGDVTSVVLFGHAFPRGIHDAFFVPLRRYIHYRLGDKVPVLYLNGDLHKFDYEQNYLGLSNFQRLQVDFGTANPPLKVAVSSSTRPGWNATDAFSHDRMLRDGR